MGDFIKTLPYLTSKVTLQKIVLMALLHMYWNPLFCQMLNKHWYFGNEAAIRFDNNGPVSLSNSNMVSIEGCTSVSDPITGELLFYTNGLQVWNKNHAIMSNGNGLSSGINTSATQGAVIVPFPSQINKYFIFTVDEALGNSSFDFRYSIVDMNLANGLGDVMSTQKNVYIQSNVTERISVAKKSDETGFWIMIHERNNTVFKAYELTGNGLNFTPVQSSIGLVHSSQNQANGDETMGYMKFNHTFDQLAIAIYTANKIQLFDFDACLGTLSNAQTLTTLDHPYGIEFSPDNSKLYYSLYYNAGFNGAIYQVNLATPSFGSSNVLVGLSSSINFQNVGALQLGPDGFIYLAINSESWLSAITQPNSLGSACNFVDQYLTLSGTGFTPSTSLLGLPPKVLQLDNSSNSTISISATSLCFGDSSFFKLNNYQDVNSVIWNFDDPTSTQNQSNEAISAHVFTNIGTYNISAVVSRKCKNDTLFKQLTIENCNGNALECQIEIPNVFSPNMDLINEQFTIKTICDFTKYELKILNRWGNIVFDSQNPTETWDGNFNGKACTEGVYFYLLNYETQNLKKQEKNGFLQLLR
jgi:gliding motility-associated-like protein